METARWGNLSKSKRRMPNREGKRTQESWLIAVNICWRILKSVPTEICIHSLLFSLHTSQGWQLWERSSPVQMAPGTPQGAFPLDGNAALPVPAAPSGGRDAGMGLPRPACRASLGHNRIAFVYFYPTDRDTGKATFAEGIQNSTLMDTGLDTREHWFLSSFLPLIHLL